MTDDGQLRLRCSFQFSDVGVRSSPVVSGPYLPGQPEFVFQPATLDLGAAGGPLGPVRIHRFLQIAAHPKRYGFGELEIGAAIERREGLAIEFEGDGEGAPFSPEISQGIGTKR